jgi:hypothetical protein
MQQSKPKSNNSKKPKQQQRYKKKNFMQSNNMDKILKQVNAVSGKLSSLNKLKIVPKAQFNNRYRQKTIDTTYLMSLLKPETAINSKIPGSTTETVSLHRTFSQIVSTNASGAFGVYWSPNFLHTNSTGSSTMYINTSLGYDGSSSFGVNAIATALPMNIPTGTVNTYRLVSASLHIVPQEAALSVRGTIHGALLDNGGVLVGATGTTLTANNGTEGNLLVGAISNTHRYAKACVTESQSLRVIWTPTSQAHLNFLDIDTNNQTVDSAASEKVMIGIVTGGGVASAYRVDFYMNFEVTPLAGSVLQGMESICYHRENPADVWQQIYLNHADLVSMAYSNTSHFSEDNPITKVVKNPSLRFRQNPTNFIYS